MSARLLEGRPVAEAIWRDIEQRTAALPRPACLGVVSGADEAAAAYGRQIERQFSRHGLVVSTRTVGGSDFLDVVHELNLDTGIDGILLLTPFPEGVNAENAAWWIDPSKDVDGQHPNNL